LQAIETLLKQYPSPVRPLKGLVVNCDADIVWDLAAKAEVPAEVRLGVLNRYLEWRIEAGTLARSGTFDDQDDIAVSKYRLGVNLVWHLNNRSEEVESLDLGSQIRSLQPARLFFEGMAQLQQSAHVPRLTKDEQKLIVATFRHGVLHEGLTLEEAWQATSHAVAMDSSATWSDGISQLDEQLAHVERACLESLQQRSELEGMH
jgi:hypothetical protein